MHGLVFKTSISLLAGSTRYLYRINCTMHACPIVGGMATQSRRCSSARLGLNSTSGLVRSHSGSGMAATPSGSSERFKSRVVHAARLSSATPTRAPADVVDPTRAASPLCACTVSITQASASGAATPQDVIWPVVRHAGARGQVCVCLYNSIQ